MPKFSIVFAALLCLVACKSQENYVLETKTAFFLMQDDSLHQKNLIALSKNGNFHNQLHQSLGIAASDLGDLVGKDNQCWVSDVKNQKIYLLSPTNQTITKTITTTNLHPTLLCVGEHHLLIGDSIQQKLDFFNVKTEKFEGGQTVAHKPILAVWNAGKFYVAYDNHELQIISEDSYTARNTITFPNPIENLQLALKSSKVDLIIQTRTATDSIKESYLELQADNFLNASQIENTPKPYYQKKYVSSYSYAPFGKESLIDYILSNQKILPLSSTTHPLFTNKNITDFEVDFFESDLYVLQNDSLKTYSLLQHRYGTQIPFKGKYLKSYYYKDFHDK